MARVVIALGGNALGNTPDEQQQMIEDAVPSLIAMVRQGHQMIISHGNGPQVGMINLAFAEASAVNRKVSPVDFPECTAMSQGYIGFHLLKELRRELELGGQALEPVTVLTQVVVDKNDPAFRVPTKPIGGYYDEAAAKELMQKNPGLVLKEEAGQGWRRVIASPRPVDIVDKNMIMDLLDHDYVVVACGGGGIPVYKDERGSYQSVPAVVDKDFASAKLAELVGADYLFILTAVDRVAIHWGTPRQQFLDDMSLEEAERYCDEGHFAPGSMLPKVEAAMEFVRSGQGRQAVIASLENAHLAIEGKSGTVIHA